jgi:hypothetical protein
VARLGDSAYANQKALIRSKAPDGQDFTNQRTRRAGGEVYEVQRGKNRNKSKIRARVEHAYAVVKAYIAGQVLLEVLRVGMGLRLGPSALQRLKRVR